MRAFHLIGLRDDEGQRIRCKPRGGVPFFLPCFVPKTDREIILAFCQQALDEVVLERIEIDWHTGIQPADTEFLTRTLKQRGGTQPLLVVKVRAPDVDLDEVWGREEIHSFESVAVTAEYAMMNERLEPLLELTLSVTNAVGRQYGAIAHDLGLRQEAWRAVLPLVQTLQNPVDVVETANVVIDVQLEKVSEEEQTGKVFYRILNRALESAAPEVAIGVAAVASGHRAQLDEIGEGEEQRIMGLLRAQRLVRDGKLQQWARWVAEAPHDKVLVDVLHERSRADAAGPQALALGWLERKEAPREPSELMQRVWLAMRLTDGGQLGRARDELSFVEARLGDASVTDEMRGDYWDAAARLDLAEGHTRRALDAFARAADLLERSGATKSSRSITLLVYARALRDNRRWSEAEPTFLEALRLNEEGGGTLESQAVILDAYARGLRDNGRWSEAEPRFLESLRLKEASGNTPVSRAITLDEYARGLRDNGRWSEAEPMFVEALRLKEEGGDTPVSRSITLHEYAGGLRDNGRWSEAEPMFAEAIRLGELGGEAPEGRAVTLDAYAEGLRRAGRVADAEAAANQAARLRRGDSAQP